MGRWDKQLISQSSHVLSTYDFFFHNFLQNSLQKLFQFTLYFFYNFTKIRIQSFEGQVSHPLFHFQSIKIILGKSDTWLMRPLTLRPSVLKIVGFLASRRYWEKVDSTQKKGVVRCQPVQTNHTVKFRLIILSTLNLC